MPARRPTFNEVMARSHLPSFDGMRAVAVFMVILFHAGWPIAGIPGDLGVSIFFVLSGCLITRLLMRERAETGDVSLRHFYLRRTLRIFPAYYAFLAFSFALDVLHGDRWGRALGLSALTYTVNYYNALTGHQAPSVGHAWSLAVEEQFYLLWPLCFLLLARISRRALVWGALCLAAAVLAWRSWLYLHVGVGMAYAYNAFDTRFDNLAIGCLLALVADAPSFGRVADAAARWSWLPLVTAGLLVSAHKLLPDPYHYSLGFTVDSVLIAVLLVQMLQLSTTRLWSWLEHPVTRYIGTISYPMYLYHGWGGSVARRLPLPDALREPGAILATIALASISYFVVERPFLRLKTRFGKAPRRGASVPVTPLPVVAPPVDVAHPRRNIAV